MIFIPYPEHGELARNLLCRTSNFIDDLKIRGGWGQSGNDEAVAGAYAYLSGVNEQASYGLGSGDGNATGNYNVAVALNDLPNRDLAWETVTTTYVGFDALLFKSKVNATVEIYDRTTKDILQFVNLPLTVGVNDPAFNIGSVQNGGVDLLLGYTGRSGDFQYNVSGNISFLQNKVLELYNNQPLTTFSFNQDVGGFSDDWKRDGRNWSGDINGFSTDLSANFQFEYPRHLLWPIPQTEIERNSAITENNPGY